MKSNIAFICLLDNYSKNVSKLLSEKLEMFYVNIDEMVQFELGDEQHILKTLGDEAGHKYILESEGKVVKNVAGFENTIISVNPTTMFDNDNFNKIADTSYIIYLQFAQNVLDAIAKETGDKIDIDLNEINFTDRDKMYVDSSNIVLNCSKLKETKAVKKLIKLIKKFFKKAMKEKKATSK